MKKLLSLLTVSILFLSIGFSQVANAEWRKSGINWVYANTDGTLKTGWLQDGANRYFLNPDGTMVIGWMHYNDTWAYFNLDGSLDNSKIIETMPEELQTAQNKLETISGQKLKYYKTITDGTSQSYEFITQDQIVYGTPSYFYTPSTGRIFELTEGILVRLDVNQLMNAKYTFDQCKELANATFSNSHENGYKFTSKSDGTVNKWGEYYFEFYSSSTGEKIDTFYVSGYNGQIRR